MLVGGGAVFDQDGVKVRLECLMPDIDGYVVSPGARGADLTAQPIPNPVDRVGNGLYKYLEKKFPAGAKAFGVITPDLPSTREAGNQNKDVVDALGWKKVYDDVYPSLGPTSWTPYAQSLKSAGVKGLIWVGEPEFLAKLIQAMNDINYSPDFISINANNYDRGLIDNAGAALKDNVYMSTPFVPFEEAKPGSATKQYLDAFAEYLPDGKARAAYGAQAFSAWLLFAQSAKACGNDLTRKCVYDNAKQVTDWTGGGLHAPQNVRANSVSECMTVLKATARGFVRVKDLAGDRRDLPLRTGRRARAEVEDRRRRHIAGCRQEHGRLQVGRSGRRERCGESVPPQLPSQAFVRSSPVVTCLRLCWDTDPVAHSSASGFRAGGAAFGDGHVPVHRSRGFDAPLGIQSRGDGGRGRASRCVAG